MRLTKVQKEAMKKKCPNCKYGKLHPVPNDEIKEIYLWCNKCLLSMDSGGGYTY
jgi:hypothetical protein